MAPREEVGGGGGWGGGEEFGGFMGVEGVGAGVHRHIEIREEDSQRSINVVLGIVFNTPS